MPNWIGDVVMATPVLRVLRESFPKASITAMCLSSLAPLLEKEGSLDGICTFEKKKRFFERKKERRRIFQVLSEGKYDVGILLTNSFSSAWWFFKGRIRQRIGYKAPFRTVFLSKALDRKRDKHQVEEYLDLLQGVSLGGFNKKRGPELFVEKQERDSVKGILYKKGVRKGQILIGMNPSAAYGPAKCWPEENFRKLAEKLLMDPDVFILFFGDSQSRKKIKRIIPGFKERVYNLAGLTSLRELMAFTAEVDLFITNDSGPMHIAAALHVSLIALFGSTDEKKTGPYQKSGVISKNVACSPCFLRKCPIDFRCMKEITVEQVYQLCKQKLREKKKHV